MKEIFFKLLGGRKRSPPHNSQVRPGVRSPSIVRCESALQTAVTSGKLGVASRSFSQLILLRQRSGNDGHEPRLHSTDSIYPTQYACFDEHVFQQKANLALGYSVQTTWILWKQRRVFRAPQCEFRGSSNVCSAELFLLRQWFVPSFN